MKILFVYQGLQSFVQKDLDILRLIHEVRPVQFTGRKELIKHIFPNLWRLWQGILWCDLTFSWFGKLHAFFAVLFSKILGKRSVVVAGGDDVANFVIAGKPYGLCSNSIGKWFAYFIFRQASLVITISQYNHKETLSNTGASSDKVKLVLHGFDGNVYRRSTDIIKGKAVLTVATVDQESYHRKGLRLFVEAAKYLPEILFYVVGPIEDKTVQHLAKLATDNVIFTGGLYGKELIKIMSRCSIYVQASEWESFGCSVAEAMLCECIPVITRSTALPEVVGECGIYLDELTSEELAEKIREAQNRPELGKRARERIVKLFPLQKRTQDLLHAIEDIRVG